MTPRLKAALFTFFFLSGFCGLLYQIVWLRLAFASFGVITPVLSAVLSVFMFGLFVGSWAAGRWIDRFCERLGVSAISFYAASEFLIGVGGWAVPRLFAAGETRLLTLGQSDSSTYLICSGLVIAGSILPWCICMGATFPLMVAFVKQLDQSDKTSFSFLYLANVIGAMLGTVLTAVFLIELLGFRGTLWVAAACNGLIALGAVAVGRAHPYRRPAAAADDSLGLPALGANASEAPRRPVTALILLTTGFTSMAMEVVWIRAFTPVLMTQVYSFAWLLFVYLLATWIGSLAYRWHLARRRVASTPLLVTLLALAALLPLGFGDPRFLFRWWSVLASIFPFCALLGYLTPKLIDEDSQGRADRVGSSYAVNVLGCILGPLTASYLLLPFFDLRIVFLILAAPYPALVLYFAATAPLAPARRRVFMSMALVSFAASFFWVKTYEDYFRENWALHEIRHDHMATVLSYGVGMNKQILVNGIGLTSLTTLTKVMAHLPLAHLQAPPKSALVICLGMGTTWRSVLSWNIRATAVELVPSVRDALPYYQKDAAALLALPNAKIVVDDGRRFLRRTTETFDVITLDPPPPVEAAGSSLLYSDEFYDAVKLRLKPQGILQQWTPLGTGDTASAIVRSLLHSFPYVRMFVGSGNWGAHFLASRSPIAHRTAEQLVARMPRSAQADLVEWLEEKNAATVLRRVLSEERDPREIAAGGNDRVTDDRPYNEYFLLRRLRDEWFAPTQQFGGYPRQPIEKQ